MKSITSADNMLAIVRNSAEGGPPFHHTGAHAHLAQPSCVHTKAWTTTGTLRQPSLEAALDFIETVHVGSQAQQGDGGNHPGPPILSTLYPASLNNPMNHVVTRQPNDGGNSLDLAETFAYAEPSAVALGAARPQRRASPIVVPTNQTQQHSDDATQDTPAPVTRHCSTSKGMEISEQPSQRPARKSAALAAARMGRPAPMQVDSVSYTSGGSGTDCSDESEDEDEGNNDEEDDAHNNAAGGGGSAAQSQRVAHTGGGGRRKKKAGGRPLQSKPYDALIDPSLPSDEIRRLRRVLSNRESARRSRKRKATQVSILQDELNDERARSALVLAELNDLKRSMVAVEAERTRLAAEVADLRAAMATQAGFELGGAQVFCS